MTDTDIEDCDGDLAEIEGIARALAESKQKHREKTEPPGDRPRPATRRKAEKRKCFRQANPATELRGSSKVQRPVSRSL